MGIYALIQDEASFMDQYGPHIDSLLRWLHVVFGVLWIGLLYFFNWVNSGFAPTMDAETKKKVIPELMPRALHWFRWGAAFTWFTGVFLMALVFYHGKAMMGNQSDPWTWQLGVGVGVTFLGVFLYDVLAKTALKNPQAMFFAGFILASAVAVAFGMFCGMSFRGSLIHLGAMFGTIMAFNVWFRIWPAQRSIIAAIKAGTPPDAGLVAMAGLRSKHNTFMSVPLIYTMLNAHHTWMAADQGPVPAEALMPIVILLGWLLVFHIYGAAKKVSGM